MTEDESKRVEELREIRKGMSWGSAEEGIPQLTTNELFLLELLDKILDK